MKPTSNTPSPSTKRSSSSQSFSDSEPPNKRQRMVGPVLAPSPSPEPSRSLHDQRDRRRASAHSAPHFAPSSSSFTTPSTLPARYRANDTLETAPWSPAAPQALPGAPHFVISNSGSPIRIHVLPSTPAGSERRAQRAIAIGEVVLPPLNPPRTPSKLNPTASSATSTASALSTAPSTLVNSFPAAAQTQTQPQTQIQSDTKPQKRSNIPFHPRRTRAHEEPCLHRFALEQRLLMSPAGIADFEYVLNTKPSFAAKLRKDSKRRQGHRDSGVSAKAEAKKGDKNLRGRKNGRANVQDARSATWELERLVERDDLDANIDLKIGSDLDVDLDMDLDSEDTGEEDEVDAVLEHYYFTHAGFDDEELGDEDAEGHAALFSKGMYGFNVTSGTFPYDNRPVAPLMQYPFSKWWFHGHINYPPNDGDFLEVPAGGTLNTEIACDKGATSYFASSPGGNIQSGDNPCPGSPTVAFHAHNIEDTRGCGLAIAYKNDINAIQPADFTIFSVNQTCVWNRFTNFDIPNLPACPEGGCFCGFFWIHAADAGSAQIYMNAYRCVVNGATSTVPLATSRIPRRCGADPDFGKPNAAPWNCTYGAKQPMYWYQSERNNMFEDAQQPPSFNDMYHFLDGRQDDIFQNSEIPVFNENGDQAGVTTLGSGTATTANIVTPSVSGGWSTTVSSLPDETSAPSASNASPNSSSAAVSSSSDKTNPPSSSNASPSSSSAAASSSPDETNVPSSSNPGPSSSPAVASSSPTSSESITTDAVQPSPSPSPSTGTGTSDSNTSGVNSNVSTPGSSSSSSPISNPTPSNSSSPAPGSPATCRRRKPSIDKRALGVHRNRLSKKLNL